MLKIVSGYRLKSLEQRVDYLEKRERAMTKDAETVANEQRQVVRSYDRLYSNEIHSDYMYSYFNLRGMTEVIRRIAEHLGLDILPPDQNGWSVRKKLPPRKVQS